MSDRPFRWLPYLVYLVAVIAVAALGFLADRAGFPPAVGSVATAVGVVLLTLVGYRGFLAGQELAGRYAREPRAAFVRRYGLAVALALGLFMAVRPVLTLLPDVAIRAAGALLAVPAAVAGWAVLAGARTRGVPRLYTASGGLAAVALGTSVVELALREPGLHPGFVWLLAC